MNGHTHTPALLDKRRLRRPVAKSDYQTLLAAFADPLPKVQAKIDELRAAKAVTAPVQKSATPLDLAKMIAEHPSFKEIERRIKTLEDNPRQIVIEKRRGS